MANKASVITKAAGAFNKVRDKFMPGERCFLLKYAEHSGRFTVITELTDSFWIRYSSYRGQFVFQYATNDETFNDDFAQTTHIAIGVPDSDDQLEVFALDPERKDVLKPSASNLIWKAFVDKEANKRFTIPEEI